MNPQPDESGPPEGLPRNSDLPDLRWQHLFRRERYAFYWAAFLIGSTMTMWLIGVVCDLVLGSTRELHLLPESLGAGIDWLLILAIGSALAFLHWVQAMRDRRERERKR